MKVKDVVLLLPSALLADSGAIEMMETSSFWIVPVAEEVPRIRPDVGFDRVTTKSSSNSTAASPATNTVIVWIVSPAAKLTLPPGSRPPKSAASAA